MGRKKIVDIFIRQRLRTAVEKAVYADKEYQCALKRQDAEFRKMGRAGLSREQDKIVDGVISATNHCGAVYGAVAYRQGLRDGIKFISELSKIE